MASLKLIPTQLRPTICSNFPFKLITAAFAKSTPLKTCARCYQAHSPPVGNSSWQKRSLPGCHFPNKTLKGYSSASFSSTDAQVPNQKDKIEQIAKMEFIQKENEDNALEAECLDFSREEAFPKIDALSTNVDIDYLNTLGPNLTASFNLAAFVNFSETLMKMVKFGIDLSWIEDKYPQLRRYIANLDFEKDVEPFIYFFKKNRLSKEEIATVLTRNPFLLAENLENLDKRILYLKSKRFTQKNVVRIITHCPNFLSFSAKDIDTRLGFLQKMFSLTGDEVRYLTLKRAKTVICPQKIILENRFTLVHDLEVDESCLKDILLAKPKVFCIDRIDLFNRFEMYTIDMGISKDLVVQNPNALLSREERVLPRHLYLVKIGAAQYDPTLPCYISLRMLTEVTDEEFCEKAAKTPIEQYNKFLKTL